MKNIFVLLLTTALFAFGACKKEGPAGPAGKDGENGNANITGKKFMTMASTWKYPGHYALDYGNNQVKLHFSKYITMEAPEITKDVIDNGLVLVYMIPKGVHNWMPLPLSFQAASPSDVVHNFAYEYRQGTLTVHYYWTANTTGKQVPDGLETTLMPFYNFRYVVASGVMMDKMKASGVNTQDPVAVEQILSRGL